ncbi:MAG: hypothetical protein FJ405_01315 [Verrucomicrobia bacterium]|nr:hypothetical protein [Verrucomicrobiota bacterium]
MNLEQDIETRLAQCLREAVEPNHPLGAARLALESVEELELNLPGLSASKGGRETHPNVRAMLTLLTYCYGLGICNPADIERSLELDPVATYLSAGASPTMTFLSSVRREYRRVLRKSLVRFFENAWIHGGTTQKGNWDHLMTPTLTLRFSQIADERITLATLWDGPVMRD